MKYPTGAAATVAYRIAFHVAMLLPGRSQRARRRRAQLISIRLLERSIQSLPLGLALAINVLILGIASLTEFDQLHRAAPDREVIQESFLLAAEPAQAPPPQGGTTALTALAEQAAALLKNGVPQASVADLSAISSTAVSPLNFDVSALSTNWAALGTPLQVGAQLPGSTRSSSEGSEVGSGTEGGSEAAGEKGKGRGTGKAEGNYGEGWSARPGRDFLRKQHVAFIVDTSGSMVPSIAEVERRIQRLSQSNKVLGKLQCESALMVSRTSRKDLQEYMGREPNSSSSEDRIPTAYKNAYACIDVACERFSGHKGLLVLISDFQESDGNEEDADMLVEKLIQAELRLYLVSLGSTPSRFCRTIAERSGGGIISF